MTYRYLLVLLLILLPAAISIPAEAVDAPPALKQSFFRVVQHIGDVDISSGSGFHSERGVLTAHHVVDLWAKNYTRHSSDGALVTGVVAVRVTDYRGREYAVTEVKQQQRRDIAVLTLDSRLPEDVPALACADVPERRSPVTAVGFFSLGFRHGNVSRSHGWYEGYSVVIHPPRSQYPYAGPILRVSAPVAKGMSGGALLDQRGRAIGVLVFVGFTQGGNPWAYSGVFKIR